jgi:colanic acid/amylovoran biosynthesis glycosyltransferase
MKADRIVAVHSFPVWLPQTQTWMYNQVKYLPEAVEVHVICDRTQHLDQFGVPNIHSLRADSELRYFWEKGLRSILFPHFHGFLNAIVPKIGAQILHSHFGPTGWVDLQAAERNRMKHLVTYYGYDVRLLPTRDKRWLNRYLELFENADLFLCEGPHMAKELIGLGCPQEKVRVHHLGVEIEKIPYKPRRMQERGPLRILIAGTFTEKKGIPYALEAIAKLMSNVPVQITIIGDADSEKLSQKEKKRILDILEKNDMKSNTRLLGFQPYSGLFEEAYRHHIFMSPSVTALNGDTEGGAPVAIIEMIATGMPVVSTMHCDIPGVVDYGIDDWLVKERDVTGLTERLRWLVENAAQWNQMLAKGRKHIEDEFDARQQGKRLFKIYQDLL